MTAERNIWKTFLFLRKQSCLHNLPKHNDGLILPEKIKDNCPPITHRNAEFSFTSTFLYFYCSYLPFSFITQSNKIHRQHHFQLKRGNWRKVVGCGKIKLISCNFNAYQFPNLTKDLHVHLYLKDCKQLKKLNHRQSSMLCAISIFLKEIFTNNWRRPSKRSLPLSNMVFLASW